MIKKLSLVLFIFLFGITVFADNRDENIDIFILLDKSLSMENNIEEVKDYIDSFIIDNIIIPGDRLLILNFYGKTEDFIDESVSSDDLKESIKKQLKSVKADGRFTDIGNALDRLTETAGEETDRIRYMLLITDGKQEAPPGTKYYSPDGTFNHELLKHTKTIQKKGWKIEVLGIGKLNRAADIAEKLSGTYVEVEKADVKDLAEKTADFLTIISIDSIPEIKKFGRKNESTVKFSAVSQNTDKISEVVIDSIKFTNSSNTVYELIDSPFRINIEPGIKTAVEIPVKIKTEMQPGISSGSLEFFYSSDKILTPSLFDVQIEKSKGINPLFIYIAAAAAAIILFLLFLSGRKTASADKDNGFEVFLNNEKLNDLPFILKNNERLFMIISRAGEISFSRIKTALAKGYVIKNAGKISFRILDNKLFPDFKDNIDNIFGKSVNIRLQSGKLLKLLFKRK